MKKRHLFAGLAAMSVLAACDGGGGGSSADTTDTTDETVDLETVEEFLANDETFLTFDTSDFETGNVLQFVYNATRSVIVIDEDTDSGLNVETYDYAEWDELEPGRDFVFGYIETTTDADTGTETSEVAYCGATTNLLKFMPNRESTNSVGARNLESSQTTYSVAFDDTERYLVLSTNATRGFVATAWDESTQTYTMCQLTRDSETGDIQCIEDNPFYITLDKTQAPVLAQSLDDAEPTPVNFDLAEIEDSYFTDSNLEEFVTTDFVGQTVYDILPLVQTEGWHVTTKELSFGQNRLVFGDNTAQYQFAYDNRALVLDYYNGTRWYVFNQGYDANLESYKTCWLSSSQLEAEQSCGNENSAITYFSLSADKAAETVTYLEADERLGASARTTHEYPDSIEGLIQCSTLTEEEVEEETADSTDTTDTTTDTTAS